MFKPVLSFFILPALVFAVLLSTSDAYALVYGADKVKNQPKMSANRISSAQAANIVRERMGGKILKVTRSGNGYRVKLVKPNGKISTVTVDGKTGRIRQ